jgi:beta-lactamase regulating signal transducer with metallopeptidase domain
MSALFDHLWQSTLFAGALGLLTLLFRANGASVRYGLWLAASMKFLLPFSALTLLGSAFFQPLAPALAAPAVLYRMQPAAQPFAAAAPTFAAPTVAGSYLEPALLMLWACGVLVVLSVWAVRWTRLRAIVIAARDMPAAGPLRVKSSAASLEPGLVGIWQPILLLPGSFAARLSEAEMQTVIAHELCHYRRRDNLTASLHMLVAALFWFYPLVWWLGARLLEERENACDERVLETGNDPQTYAASILKVCRFYLHSPLACAAGVSGADLKKRMERIMENRSARRLTSLKKLLLGAFAAAAIAVPVMVGLATATRADDAATPAQVKQKLAEQALPRKEIAIDPASFDKFAGYYQMAPNVIFVISRKGNHYFQNSIGQAPDEMYPESPSKFFLKGASPAAQFSFTTDAQGRVIGMVLHQSGTEQHAVRIDDAVGRQAEDTLKRRIAANKPSAGTEAALRHQIDGLASGHPDYDKMAPTLAAGTRQMLPDLHAMIAKWGAVKSVTFTGVGTDGLDNYLVVSQNARSRWEIGPLTDDGKIGSILFSEEH